MTTHQKRALASLLLFALLFIVLGCSKEQSADSQPLSVQDSKQAAIAALQEQNKKDFLRLMDLSMTSVGIAVYDVKEAEKGEEIDAYTMKRITDGSRLRADIIRGGAEIREYHLDSAITSCKGMGDSWDCEEIAPRNAQASKGILEDAQEYSVEYNGAGIFGAYGGSCYLATKRFSADARICISKEGVLLSRTFTDGDWKLSETIVSYEQSVSDLEFKIP